MKAEYDLSQMKSRKNPYASKLKKAVTMRLSEDVVAYFKRMAVDAGVPYQLIIGPIALAMGRQRRGSCESLFLQREISIEVHLRRFDRLVPEPECDHQAVGAAVKQVHRSWGPGDFAAFFDGSGSEDWRGFPDDGRCNALIDSGILLPT